MQSLKYSRWLPGTFSAVAKVFCMVKKAKKVNKPQIKYDIWVHRHDFSLSQCEYMGFFILLCAW